jgi:hypothetical protein
MPQSGRFGGPGRSLDDGLIVGARFGNGSRFSSSSVRGSAGRLIAGGIALPEDGASVRHR